MGRSMSADVWVVSIVTYLFLSAMFGVLYSLPRIVEWLDPSLAEEDPNSEF
jgi:hypothetical protein